MRTSRHDRESLLAVEADGGVAVVNPDHWAEATQIFDRARVFMQRV